MMATWSTPLEELARRAGQDIETVIKRSALTLFSLIVQRSPVDTGRFRGNWNPSIGEMDTSTDWTSYDPGGSGTISRAQATVEQMKLGDTVYLTNSLPYARRLEYEGWSQQAPTGMVRVSVFEFRRAIDQAVEGLRRGQ